MTYNEALEKIAKLAEVERQLTEMIADAYEILAAVEDMEPAELVNKSREWLNRIDKEGT